MVSQANQAQGASSLASGATPPTSRGPRLFYIDNLRILLTVLVILTHLAIGYGAAGDWYYNEEGTLSEVAAILMTLFVVVNQAFFMGFFFLISSYFTPGSYERRGAGPYLLDRLRRLGIPLLFYSVILEPLVRYVSQAFPGLQVGIWRFVQAQGERAFGVGPLWFVETLLILSCLYVLWRLLAKVAPTPPQSDGEAPRNGALALFSLALGVATFVVRIWLPVGWWFEPLHLQLAHFPQYIALYVAGIVAYRRRWFSEVSGAQARTWRWIVLALIALFPILFVAGGALAGDLTPFLGGLHWQSLTYSMWEQFMCIAMVTTLLVWFRRRYNYQGDLARAMSRAAYIVYIIHPPVVVLLQAALSGIRLDLGVKFIMVAPMAVILCFLIGHWVRKLPLARGVL